MNTHKLQNGFCRRRKPSRTRAIIFAAVLAAVFPAAAQTTAISATDFAAFQVVSQRNIFNQYRMPHEHAAQVRIPDSFSLVGTLFYADGDIAFFDGTSDAWRKALKVGGDIAGFKITAMTLDSVTLSSGTNETVLQVATQMRRDDNGSWSVSTEPASYANAGGLPGSGSGRTYSNHSRRYRYDSAQSNSTVIAVGGTTNGVVDSSSPNVEDTSSAAPTPPGAASDALSRLMQRRAQQEQQIGQGQ